MVQSSFVERAKQGDPTAIAYLINLTLQPRGVTAKIYLNDRCLYLVFSADRLLNRTTLINFLQHGFAVLETRDIERVKVYAQKTGEPLPAWSEEICLQPGPTYPSASSPLSLHFRAISMLGPDWSKVGPRLSQICQQVGSRLRQFLIEPPLHPGKLRRHPITSKRLTVAGLAIFTVMLLGSVVTMRLNRRVPQTSPAVPLTSRTVASPNPEAEAKRYLEQMNQAQQSFYAKNGRLATSLEELERSAGILSQSDSYLYQLSSPIPNQSILTAVPQVERLKSYVAIVNFDDSNATSSSTSQICASSYPATLPPSIPKAIGSTLQCPDGSTSVLPQHTSTPL
ncbi:MAG: type IV pilin-like G/H family protein [Leptolyngbyaceae cyanobacterium]